MGVAPFWASGSTLISRPSPRGPWASCGPLDELLHLLAGHPGLLLQLGGHLILLDQVLELPQHELRLRGVGRDRLLRVHRGRLRPRRRLRLVLADLVSARLWRTLAPTAPLRRLIPAAGLVLPLRCRRWSLAPLAARPTAAPSPPADPVVRLDSTAVPAAVPSRRLGLAVRPGLASSPPYRPGPAAGPSRRPGPAAGPGLACWPFSAPAGPCCSGLVLAAWPSLAWPCCWPFSPPWPCCWPCPCCWPFCWPWPCCWPFSPPWPCCWPFSLGLAPGLACWPFSPAWPCCWPFSAPWPCCWPFSAAWPCCWPFSGPGLAGPSRRPCPCCWPFCPLSRGLALLLALLCRPDPAAGPSRRPWPCCWPFSAALALLAALSLLLTLLAGLALLLALLAPGPAAGPSRRLALLLALLAGLALLLALSPAWPCCWPFSLPGPASAAVPSRRPWPCCWPCSGPGPAAGPSRC